MSKRSEEAALKAYPNESFVSIEYADMCRNFYQEGYELAEKDLALTWEDLQAINDLFFQVDAENGEAWDYEVIEQDLPFPYGQKFYEEVLRRFRESKNK